MTATTPSSTAVRLDTGVVALEVSNSTPSSNLLHGQLRRSTLCFRLIFYFTGSVDSNFGWLKIPWNHLRMTVTVKSESKVYFTCLLRLLKEEPLISNGVQVAG